MQPSNYRRGGILVRDLGRIAGPVLRLRPLAHRLYGPLPLSPPINQLLTLPQNPLSVIAFLIGPWLSLPLLSSALHNTSNLGRCEGRPSIGKSLPAPPDPFQISETCQISVKLQVHTCMATSYGSSMRHVACLVDDFNSLTFVDHNIVGH